MDSLSKEGPDGALPFALYLITDLDVAGGEDALLAAVDAALDAVGAGVAIQLRDKRRPQALRERLGHAIRERTRAHDALLFVNSPDGDPTLARDVGADGVHLPDGILVDAISLVGLRVARSAHDSDGLRRARDEGAAFATLSPVLTSPGKGRPLGWDRFEAAAEASRLPVAALGGMYATDAGEARRRGAAAVATIRGVLAASDPGAAAAEFVELFRTGPAS
jgi:thiamine-phosphate diphosphorylase